VYNTVYEKLQSFGPAAEIQCAFRQ